MRTIGKAVRDERTSSGHAPREGEAAGVTAKELENHLAALLEPDHFSDYCPNGLQVEGQGAISRLVTGVTASRCLIERAIDARAQAVLVHHGIFWRGDSPVITGVHGARIRLLMVHGLHLFAYHLPLDAHPVLGNNARFASAMGWAVDARFGAHGLGCLHDLPKPLMPSTLASRLARALGRRPLVVGAPDTPVRRLAWCTGGAQDMLGDAIAAGAQAFVSGEISERTTHLAREAGVSYFAAGHHATERFGVQALGERLAADLGIAHSFIDDPNPV